MSDPAKLRDWAAVLDGMNAASKETWRSELIIDLRAAADEIEQLRDALSALVDRWEPDTEGTDRQMWENAMKALGREIWGA